MMKFAMKAAAVCGAAAMIAAVPDIAAAQFGGGSGMGTGGLTKAGSAPEINALSGLAALAVVGAAVALIRERSK